jgi:hypothetical protein
LEINATEYISADNNTDLDLKKSENNSQEKNIYAFDETPYAVTEEITSISASSSNSSKDNDILSLREKVTKRVYECNSLMKLNKILNIFDDENK